MSDSSAAQTGLVTGVFEGPGLRLAYRRFVPESPRGRLFLHHGLAEYGRRYEAFGAACAAAGWELAVHDHRGHGDSEGPRGHVERFEAYLSDAAAFRAWLLETHPLEGPCWLYGHSMGGLIATRYVLEHPDHFDGLILTAPLFGVAARIPLAKRLAANLLARLTPRVTLATGLDLDTLSRDPERVADYANDPKIDRGATAGWYGQALAAMELVRERAAELTLPLLILHGSADAITSPAASRAVYDAARSTDKDYILLDGHYHELLQEPLPIRQAIEQRIIEQLERSRTQPPDPSEEAPCPRC